MWASRGLGAGLAGAILILLMAVGAEALTKCLICHGKPALSKTLPSGRVLSLFVDEKQLKESVHAARTCTEKS